MSTNFSTIAPLSASTISRAPSFVKEGNAQVNAESKASQPVASSSIYDDGSQKKKSHWFMKTIVALGVIAGGLVLAKQHLPQIKNFDSSGKFADMKGFKDKAFYAVSKGGEEIIKYWNLGFAKVKGMFSKAEATAKPETVVKPEAAK